MTIIVCDIDQVLKRWVPPEAEIVRLNGKKKKKELSFFYRRLGPKASGLDIPKDGEVLC